MYSLIPIIILFELSYDQRISRTLLLQEALDGYIEQCVDRANPEDFIHLFLNNSERLVEFLEHLVKSDTRYIYLKR